MRRFDKALEVVVVQHGFYAEMVAALHVLAWLGILDVVNRNTRGGIGQVRVQAAARDGVL